MPEATISHIGRLGDGVFSHNGRDHHLAFTLPGETVEISFDGKHAKLERIINPSPDRVAPPCPHFGQCGGCQMQHASDALYTRWKRSLLTTPLQQAGIEHAIDEWHVFDISSRRKAVFSVQRVQGALKFGFARAGSNTIIDIDGVVPANIDEVNPKVNKAFRKLLGLVYPAMRLTYDTKKHEASTLELITKNI